MLKFEIIQHSFTPNILDILRRHYGDYAEDVFQASPVLGYLNNKTKSANQGSKARGAFANHYALYDVDEDYIQKGFAKGKAEISYSKYQGAKFSDLFRRQRELPFGVKFQNHALNARLNDEFEKFYPVIKKPLIVRDLTTQRYWIQEDLLHVTIRRKDGTNHTYNIAYAIIEIIDAYVAAKKAAFEGFLEACRQISELGKQNPNRAVDFVIQQLQPNVDARIFEIVSYAVLKAKYGQETVWIGGTKNSVAERWLILYKTGRTNANDGGIDFVMRPLGRFFQVTETVDVNKYFLDIDKVQRFPITIVVKSNESKNQIRNAIRAQAVAKYNIEDLVAAFDIVLKANQLQKVMDEIVIQSKVEFNYNDENEEISRISSGRVNN